MSDQEKAALLAAGEKRLAFFERAMKENIQEKDLALARVYRCKYDGALHMLEALGLLTHEERENRSGDMFVRFMEAAFPESDPKEDV